LGHREVMEGRSRSEIVDGDRFHCCFSLSSAWWNTRCAVTSALLAAARIASQVKPKLVRSATAVVSTSGRGVLTTAEPGSQIADDGVVLDGLGCHRIKRLGAVLRHHVVPLCHHLVEVVTIFAAGHPGLPTFCQPTLRRKRAQAPHRGSARRQNRWFAACCGDPATLSMWCPDTSLPIAACSTFVPHDTGNQGRQAVERRWTTGR